MAQYPKIDSIGSIGSMILAILEVQVHLTSLAPKAPCSFIVDTYHIMTLGPMYIPESYSEPLGWQQRAQNNGLISQNRYYKN